MKYNECILRELLSVITRLYNLVVILLIVTLQTTVHIKRPIRRHQRVDHSLLIQALVQYLLSEKQSSTNASSARYRMDISDYFSFALVDNYTAAELLVRRVHALKITVIFGSNRVLPKTRSKNNNNIHMIIKTGCPRLQSNNIYP